MATGTVKKYLGDKGFGFICPDEGDQPEHFFHIKNFSANGFIPEAGTRVEYNSGEGRKPGQREAFQVSALSSNSDSAKVGATVQPKPRTPGEPRTAPDTTPKPLPTGKLPLPFNFVPIELEALAVTDTPVWHDGSGGQNHRHTGELSITLTALTPLLVGNQQYHAKDADKAKEVIERVMDEKGREQQESRYALPGFPISVRPTKTVVEPLRLSDGRMGVPGASIKGMLRQSVGALLSAPMERVGERVYSYRPNIGLADDQSFRKVRPAVIRDIASDGVVSVDIIGNLNAVWFAREDAVTLIRASLTVSGQCSAIAGICWTHPKKNGAPIRQKRHIETERINQTFTQDTQYKGKSWFFEYDGGLDGAGLFAKAYSDKSPGPYRGVLIKEDDYDPVSAISLSIQESVIAHYLSSLEHLYDTANGHLSSRHPKAPAERQVRTSIEIVATRWQTQNRRQLIGRLIFVELEALPDKKTWEIVSFGHNFYYRWRYVDSVRRRGGKSEDRAVLRPLACERESDTEWGSEGHRPPAKLTGARLLFGYAPDDKRREDAIGTGRYTRLAGRIRINFAVECLNEGLSAKGFARFITWNDGRWLPLKPLGMPRPSAAEHYLRQPGDAAELAKKRGDRGDLFTYGDLPERDEPGELAGRKFYLHQPDAENDAACYALSVSEAELIASDQAHLVRGMSTPGSQFLFTLAYADLRLWELGALLVALVPHCWLPKLVEQLAARDGSAFGGLRASLDALAETARTEKRPTLALKLGHGRPLGLGSVQLEIDKFARLDVTGEMPKRNEFKAGVDAELAANAIFALADKLAEGHDHEALARHLERWAAIHQYAGRSRSAYPLAGPRGMETIFAHHSNIRRNHAKQRRLAPSDASVSKRD